VRLSGRRALIAGASQGFGFAVARAFLQEGGRVMLCARDTGRLQHAHQELRDIVGDGSRVLAMPADVSMPDQVERLVDAAVSGLGGLDIVVCNAAVHGPKGPLHEVDWAEWARTIEINLLGTVLLCRAAVAQYRPQGHGKIILLSGGGATKPRPNLSAYAASKAAVVRLGETLAEEVRGFGIDVNAVAPGTLATRLLDDLLAAGPDRVGRAEFEQALRHKMEGGSPMERGTSLCVFLASRKATASREG